MTIDFTFPHAHDVPLGPDSVVDAFVAHTGTVHLLERHPWGYGAACTNRMLIGQQILTQVREVTCGRCLGHGLGETYEVRVPDKRYKVGYRVAHEGIPTVEEAQALADELGDKATIGSVPVEEET